MYVYIYIYIYIYTVNLFEVFSETLFESCYSYITTTLEATRKPLPQNPLLFWCQNILATS